MNKRQKQTKTLIQCYPKDYIPTPSSFLVYLSPCPGQFSEFPFLGDLHQTLVFWLFFLRGSCSVDFSYP